MAILMPSLRRASNQAKAAICRSNLKNIALACLTYAQSNEDRLPTSFDEDRLFKQRNIAALKFPDPRFAYPWHYYLWAYHKDFKLYACPLVPKMMASSPASGGIWGGWRTDVPAFDNFTYKDGFNSIRSGYGYNNFLGGLGSKSPMKTADLSSNVGLFGDSWLRNPQYDAGRVFERAFAASYMYSTLSLTIYGDDRHAGRGKSKDGGNSGRAHVVFMDGHLEALRRDDVVSLPTDNWNDNVFYVK
jgi:prepilin-type processing-associated H-X9-DG protein